MAERQAMSTNCVHCGRYRTEHINGSECVGSGNTTFSTMELPDGHTCGECYAFPFCFKIIGIQEDSTKCDFFPVRFIERGKP